MYSFVTVILLSTAFLSSAYGLKCFEGTLHMDGSGNTYSVQCPQNTTHCQKLIRQVIRDGSSEYSYRCGTKEHRPVECVATEGKVQVQSTEKEESTTPAERPRKNWSDEVAERVSKHDVNQTTVETKTICYCNEELCNGVESVSTGVFAALFVTVASYVALV